MRSYIYSEEYLVSQLRKGEPQAFETLYNQYFDRLLVMANRYTRNIQDAEDIVEDAFIRLWNQRQEQVNADTIAVFLYRSVKYKCYDYLRHNTVKKEHQPALIRLLDTNEEGDFSVELIRLEMIRLIYDLAATLPEKMKAIFLLTYESGLKPAEIAERLQISVQTVKNQRIKAVHLLRQSLKGETLLMLMLMFRILAQRIF